MQILEPPKTESYSNQEGHFIKTFLISTKANQAGWQVSKDTIKDNVQSFVGKPFVIIPDELSSSRQKGHIFADTKEQLLEDYKKHTHGIISSISEPFSYNDGSDDTFYMANIKLNDSKAASALLEHGAKTWIPFAVSPHIWGDTNGVWEGISLSLVPKGAYGQDAVVSKYCKGSESSCNSSLAAGVCPNDDSKAASMISSLVSNSQNESIMSQVVPQVQQIPNKDSITEQPKEVQKEEQKGVTLSQEEYDSLKKEVESKKQLNEQVTALLNENKTTKLNNIFKSVKDEALKKTLTEKYFNADVNQLTDFYGDVTAHVFPALVEEAKAQAESELKAKTIEENKGKSKAASLPKEPRVEEESKAASVVPKSENQILKLSKMFSGGIL